MSITKFAQRAIFMAIGITAAAVLVVPSWDARAQAQAQPQPQPQPQESSAVEQANADAIRNMMTEWNVKGFDPGVLVKKYMADDVTVKFTETMAHLVGAAAVTKTWTDFHAKGEVNVTKILSTYTKGPLVVVHRIDGSVTPGKPDREFEVLGIFIMKSGKIKEWHDYYINWNGRQQYD